MIFSVSKTDWMDILSAFAILKAQEKGAYLWTLKSVKKIQLARREAGLTQEQAAEKLSVSRKTISNWENEKSYPDIISVIKMSDLYGISLDILLKGEEKRKNVK